MASANVQSALDALIDAIRSELRDEFLVLLGSSVGQVPVPARPRPRGSQGRVKDGGGRRSSDDVEATGAALLAYVKANPDQRVEQIAQGMGVSTKILKLPILKLLQRPAKLTRKGVRRGTSYRAK